MINLFLQFICREIAVSDILNNIIYSLLVHCLSNIIQGTEISEGGGWEETQNWLIAL